MTDFFEASGTSNETDMGAAGFVAWKWATPCWAWSDSKQMAAEGLDTPHWLATRNASDPQINGEFPWSHNPDVPPRMRRALNMQAHWAVWYYEAIRLLDECQQRHRCLGDDSVTETSWPSHWCPACRSKSSSSLM